MGRDAPVGVFDSGIGGLSVLGALRARLPGEQFVYYADSAHAPYGERGDAFVIDRTLQVADLLVREHGVKALVVACNTATAAAIHLLRETWPVMPIVGVEPALKPALALTRTGRVAVLATRGTLASAKFARLRERHAGAAVDVQAIACDGLAEAIEQEDRARIHALCARYLAEAGSLGDCPGETDVIVLGCTHYPFALPVFRALTNKCVHFVETGDSVAKHTANLLDSAELGARPQVGGRVQLIGSLSAQSRNVASRLLTALEP